MKFRESNPLEHARKWKPHRTNTATRYYVFLILAVVLGLSVAFVLSGLLSQPEDNFVKQLSQILIFFFVICGVGIYFQIDRHNRLSKEHPSVKNTNLNVYLSFVWLSCLLIPITIFCFNRTYGTDKNHRDMFEFNFVSSFIGLTLTGLYFFHATSEVARTRWGMDVPPILSAHLSELVLGTSGLLEGVAAFRELSRSAYANGGSCNIGDLNSELVKISRNGTTVRYACETDTSNTLDVNVADGTSCNVMCSVFYVKPVTCYDYGLLGARWTILHESNAAKFCCHPMACNPNTQLYDPEACSETTDGCVNKH